MYNPFKKKSKVNTIIYGCFHDKTEEITPKLASLDIPADTIVLNDGTYKYYLYGTTKDFQTIQRTDAKGLEAKIESLAFCKGVVIEKAGTNAQQILERPEVVVLKDGRIFVNSIMLEAEYIKIILDLIKNAKEIFDYSETDRKYNDFVGN